MCIVAGQVAPGLLRGRRVARHVGALHKVHSLLVDDARGLDRVPPLFACSRRAPLPAARVEVAPRVQLGARSRWGTRQNATADAPREGGSSLTAPSGRVLKHQGCCLSKCKHLNRRPPQTPPRATCLPGTGRHRDRRWTTHGPRRRAVAIVRSGVQVRRWRGRAGTKGIPCRR